MVGGGSRSSCKSSWVEEQPTRVRFVALPQGELGGGADGRQEFERKGFLFGNQDLGRSMLATITI